MVSVNEKALCGTVFFIKGKIKTKGTVIARRAF